MRIFPVVVASLCLAATIGVSAAHAEEVRRFRVMVARAQASTAISPAVLAQIASQARGLLQR